MDKTFFQLETDSHVRDGCLLKVNDSLDDGKSTKSFVPFQCCRLPRWPCSHENPSHADLSASKRSSFEMLLRSAASLLLRPRKMITGNQGHTTQC